MRIQSRLSQFFLVILFGSVTVSFAQGPAAITPGDAAKTSQVAGPQITATPTPTPTATPAPKTNFFRNVARDQKAIWLSPFRLKTKDLEWLAPLAATEAGLILTDRKTSLWVRRNGTLPKVSSDVSLIGSTYATIGVVGGFYLIGRFAHNDHARETGELATESLLDTAIVTEVLKFAAGRMRPDDGTGHGTFFKHGSSFPSGHASSSWAVATVIAYEYQDHPFIKYGAFAVAAAISMSRYSGRNHFLGDILVGGAIGFANGRFVYRTHHVRTPAGTVKGPNGNFSWIPRISSYYDRRTLTRGGSLIWDF